MQDAEPIQSPPIETLSIPSGPYLPLEDIVAPLFFNSYLYVPRDPQFLDGFLEILPQSYSHTSIGSHLHLATLAVSFFSVAAWTGRRDLLRSSEEFFMKALPRVREALQCDISRNLDELFTTVLLLNMYEVGLYGLVFCRPWLNNAKEFYAIKEWSRPAKTHLRGAVALVNYTRPGQLDSPFSGKIANAVQNQIVGISLRRTAQY